MNQTWITFPNADGSGGSIDFNRFLNIDLFSNDTLTDVINDLEKLYPPIFSSSTIISEIFHNNSNGNISTVNEKSSVHVMSSFEKFILPFLMSTMALLTVFGNSLVIMAFICDPSIRTYSNYFILNLSIADLLIGLICIPLYAHKIIIGEWYLGYILCKLWLVFDYVVGSASTLCIVVISYDRYQMVSKGLNYVSKISIRRALKFIIGTWIIAILNYGPAILLWDWFPSAEQFDYHTCGPPFKNNFPYLVTTAFVEFFVPFFSLTILNLLVYMNIRQRSRGLIRSSNHKHKSNAIDSALLTTLPHTKIHHNNGSENDFNENNGSHHEQELTQMNSTINNTSNNSNPLPVTTTYSKSSSSAALARDRKAAKSLFILVFAFAICWCPYTFLTLIISLCKQPGECISDVIYEITFWLLWLNSTINPVLYSFLHVKFRKAYYRILCCYSVRHRNRSRRY